MKAFEENGELEKPGRHVIIKLKLPLSLTEQYLYQTKPNILTSTAGNNEQIHYHFALPGH